MTRIARRSRRGFVLVAVVIVVAAAILVATGALFTARAATAGARAGDQERELRAAALDGVALAAESLASQRREILGGATPALDSLVLAVADGAARIEVRAMPLGNGKTLESENAKLDLHALGAAALSALVAEDSREAQELVERIASARPLSSVDGAAALVASGERGLALRALLGPLRTLGESDAKDAPAPLVSLLSVHAREALVRRDGTRRLDLVAAFDESSGAGSSTASLSEFEDAEREVLARLVETAAKDAESASDDGAIARALLARGIATDRIDAILDLATLEAGESAPARLDIVRADARAIAAIPGLDREIADRIVDLRDSLDERERLGIGWLLSRRVLDGERFGKIAGLVTGRSTMWRFRIEARRAMEGSSDDAPLDADERSGAGSASSDALSSAVVAFDCIVDVAGEEPRIVFLREVSMLPAARLLLATQQASASESGARARADEPVNESVNESGDEAAGESRTSADDFPSAEASTVSNSERAEESPFSDRIELPRETAARPLEDSARPATIERSVRRAQTSRTGRDVVPDTR